MTVRVAVLKPKSKLEVKRVDPAEAVGGYLELYTHPELSLVSVMAYMNEEPERSEATQNFWAENLNVWIFGTVVFVNVSNVEDQKDLTDLQIEAIHRFVGAGR